MTALQRHDLLMLTPACSERIGASMADDAVLHGKRMAQEFGAGNIPAIVRRSAPCDAGSIGVGISLPVRIDDHRLRFSAAVLPAEISAVISPFELLASAAPCASPQLDALNRVRADLPIGSGNLGVFGACALQLATGKDYLHAASDIDLLIRAESFAALCVTHAMLSEFERETSIRVDCEVVLANGGGVKLKELLSEQKSVLVKTMRSVELLSRAEAIASLAQ